MKNSNSPQRIEEYHLTSDDLDRILRDAHRDDTAARMSTFLECHSGDCFVATNEFDTAYRDDGESDSVPLGR